MRNTLSYNEHKVKNKVAELIYAANYPKDTDKLNFTDKLNMLKKLADLNTRVKKNSIHISLNFDPSEKLSIEQYQQIAQKYMQGIGYGNQPYLVYEHRDIARRHLHIVTTNVQANGERIASHNIGKNESTRIRKAIEQEFGLIEAEKQKLTAEQTLSPINTGKLTYGKGETKKEIQDRLAVLLEQYKYCSLTELNTLLRLYNIYADPGTKESRINKHRGLVYRILNDKGKPVGVGIKASAMYMRPTISNLEKIFAENKLITNRKERRIRNAIELAFRNQKINSMAQFRAILKNSNIDVHFWQNDKGLVYGLTYNDHESKWVLNGKKVGDNFSANAIKNRLSSPAITIKPIQEQKYEPHFFVMPHKDLFFNAVSDLNRILWSEHYEESISQQMSQYKKRKKRKKQLRH